MDALYQPLLNANSTRRLVLEPGSGHDPLHATLEQIDLADNHGFEAVSYPWGDEQRQKYIIINGSRILIRHNLWTFLHRLRRRDRKRNLWVDALCISQTNLEEKAKHIAIIDKIFRYARRVLAWVGEHADGSEMLFRGWPISSTSRQAWNRLLGQRKLSRQQVEMRKRVWSRFLDRTYFKRTWIVQEIAVAHRVIVHCGHDTIDWAELVESRIDEALENFDGLSLEFGGSERPEGIDRLGVLHELRQRRGGATTTIFDLVGVFEKNLCFDARDKVYALLSLETREQRTQPIIADYTIDMSALFVQVVSQRIHLVTPLTRHAGAQHIKTLAQGLKLDRRERLRAIQIMEENGIRDLKDLRKLKHWMLLLDMMTAGMDRVGRQHLPSDMLMINGGNMPIEQFEARQGWERLEDRRRWIELDLLANTTPSASRGPAALLRDAFVDEYDEVEDDTSSEISDQDTDDYSGTPEPKFIVEHLSSDHDGVVEEIEYPVERSRNRRRERTRRHHIRV